MTGTTTDAGHGQEAPLILRRPVATVGVISIAIGLGNAVWFARTRQLGAFNIDEAGYLANALRDHRAVGIDLVETAKGFVDTTTGPLVPILSVIPLLIGPRTVLAAWVVQPFLHGVTAVAAAGLARRLGGPVAALISGIVVLCLPGALLASRSYQFAPAAAACLLLALWALVASDRGARTDRMIGFGAAVGGLLLARTMTAGFLPALGIAALVVIRPNRRGLRNLCLAALTTLVIAGPWWYLQWHGITDYLLGFGYGRHAGDYGSSGLADRFHARRRTVLIDVRWPLLNVAGAALLVLGVQRFTSSRSVDPGLDAEPEGSAVDAPPDRVGPDRAAGRRELLAATIVFAGGWVALLSTSNKGIWFELPLELLAVVVLVALACQVRGRIGVGLAVWVLTICAITLVASWSDRGGTTTGIRRDFYAGLESDQVLTTRADPRFASNDATVRRRAAAEWWEANEELGRAIQRHRRGGPVVQTVNGSTVLINSETMRLREELSGHHLGPITDPDSSDPDATFEDDLEASEGGVPRVVVIFWTDSEPFPNDTGRTRFAAAAERAGWEEAEVIPLPDGGRAQVLVHDG